MSGISWQHVGHAGLCGTLLDTAGQCWTFAPLPRNSHRPFARHAGLCVTLSGRVGSMPDIAGNQPGKSQSWKFAGQKIGEDRFFLGIYLLSE
jgi:hypothetical protein